MLKILATTVAVNLFALCVTAEPELRGSPKDMAEHLRSIPGQVSLVGEGRLEIEADTAEVVLRVRNSDRSLKTALVENQRIRGDIVDVLLKNGISSNGIHMSRFTSTPNTGFFSSKVKSYDVESKIAVEAKSEKEVQAIAAIVDEKESVTLVSMTFTDSQKDKHAEEVLNKAIVKIKNLKTLYEKEFGVVLVPRSMAPQSYLEENELSRLRPITRAFAGQIEPSALVHTLARREDAPSQFGQIKYESNVTATFDVIVEQRK